MNILMLTPSFHPSVGGVQTHVRRVAEELVAKGHRVAVLTRRLDQSWAEREQVGCIAVVRVPARRGPVKAWHCVKRMLADCDVVHCHDAYSFVRYYLPFRFLRPRLPVFITFHGYEGWPIRMQARLFRRLAARLCRGAICVGGFIPKYYGTRCDVISYGGVDIAALAGPESAQHVQPERAAAFVGRLEPDTGILTYIKALSMLRQERGVSIPLHICGEGSLAAEVERLRRTCDLPIFMHGQVQDPAHYLSRCEMAFVTGYLSILTAMALGRRVFAVYDTPIKQDYLRCFPAADKMVIAGSAEALAEELLQHLSNPMLVIEQVTAAREFALSQTWEKVAQSYLDLYYRVELGAQTD